MAGINHQAWFLQLRHHTYRGEDLYPRLWQALEQPESYDRDRVRFEVLRHFGYFVTESSRHMSEYVPWFRRTAEDRERYTPASTPDFRRPAPTNGAGSGARRRAWWRRGSWYRPHPPAAGVGEHQAADRRRGPIDFKRSREYCSYIVHAVESNTPFRFNGNVPNTGLITNLPPGCNVEVPILTDGAGLHPCHVGDLPSQLAAINRTNVNVQELAVQGFPRRDREAIHQACALDPLAAATTSLSDIRSMVDELFEANARWLDGWAARAPAGAGCRRAAIHGAPRAR